MVLKLYMLSIIMEELVIYKMDRTMAIIVQPAILFILSRFLHKHL
jgi:hypothetical protein